MSEALAEVRNCGKSAVDQNDKACALCMNKVAKTFETNGSLLGDLNLLSSPLTGVKEELEVVSGVDPARLEAEVLNPVAHVARLKIMLSVFRGNCRFADFAECTALSGGHLLYHVRKLVEHGFIAKDSAGGYQLTLKGVRVLALLTQLDKEK
jgi:DNA-binding HxlR family transcriptional regulator